MRLVIDVPGVDTVNRYSDGERVTLAREGRDTYWGKVVARGDSRATATMGTLGDVGPIEVGDYDGEFVRRAVVEFRSTVPGKLERLNPGRDYIDVRDYNGNRIRTWIKQLFDIKQVHR